MTDSSPRPATPDRDALIQLLVRETGTGQDAVADMVDAVARGETEAEFLGLTPDVFATLENGAIAYYTGKRYAEAQVLFEGLLYLSAYKRPSAWRGLAACHQAQHFYEDASRCFANAVALDPNDFRSSTHCAECLCLLGRREEGLSILRYVVAAIPSTDEQTSYALRAKALLEAGGGPGVPSPMARKGKATSEEKRRLEASLHPLATVEGAKSHPKDDATTLERLAEIEVELAVARRGPIPDEAIQQQLADPETRARLEQIADAVNDKMLTIRELADFSEEQMDAAYAVACLHLERNELLQAMQVTTMMMWIDSRDTRFYRLAGLCAHRLKLFCLADYFYALVDIWRPGGADPATLIYRGEAKMMSDELQAGMAMIQDGIKRGEGDLKMADLIRRGKALLLHGASMQQRAGATGAPGSAG